MCEIVVLENSSILQFIPDQYKIQKMLEKAVNDYPFMLEFVPNYHKTQETCIRHFP